MAAYHIAQYNVARMRAPLDDPLMRGFVSRLDELNHPGDRTPGFVWRFQTEDGHSTSVRPYEDELIIINMSVWDSIDALHAFAYRSDHGPVYAARKNGGSSRWSRRRWCSGGCPPATNRTPRRGRPGWSCCAAAARRRQRLR